MAAHRLLENRTFPGFRGLDPLLARRRLSQAHSVGRSIGRCERCVQLEGGEFRQRDETWAFAEVWEKFAYPQAAVRDRPLLAGFGHRWRIVIHGNKSPC